MTSKINIWDLSFHKRVSQLSISSLRVSVRVDFSTWSHKCLSASDPPHSSLHSTFYKDNDGGVADAVRLYQTERTRFEDLLQKRRNAITKGHESAASLDWRDREELDRIKQAQKKVYISMVSLSASATSLTDELKRERAKLLNSNQPSGTGEGEDGKWPVDT